MIQSSTNSSFPSQVVPDAEKNSLEYGMKVAQAIEGEWWNGEKSGSRYTSLFSNFNLLRLYARGEQPVQKYKDELAIDGDLSYLNLDWTPIPIIPKFVDILVNGMSQRNHQIKASAQDPVSIASKTNFVEAVIRDMAAKEVFESLKERTGKSFYNSPLAEKGLLPESKEDLELYMQLTYKQQHEIAQEQLIDYVFDINKYQLTRRRLIKDLVEIGIACTKTGFNRTEGITIDYVDPAAIVYSYSEDPNFEDLFYVGEVKYITLAELKKEFPHITEEELKEISKFTGSSANYYRTAAQQSQYDDKVAVLYFEYKTYQNQVFKIKKTERGLEKAIQRDDSFNPEPNDNFSKVSRTIEVLYSGAKVLGIEKMLKWELCENMTRPYADTTRVKMNYSLCAPKMYRGRIESTVSRVINFADMIQITHLKLQQVISKIVPDGVYLDADGLAEIDLGNGTNYNPAEALNMYFQTGSIIGRSQTQDGDRNSGALPIKELQTSSGNAKIQSLIQTYQYYLQMIRDVTGLNEARDGSMPDKDALVGIQKIAAANSNTATRHILQAALYLTLRTAENISLRVSDAIEFDLTKEALLHSLNPFNLTALKEMADKQLADFGIFLELEPDEEEKQKLEQNIQIALQSGGINLEDAIDIREINNIKLANKSIKIKRAAKEKAEFQKQQAIVQQQAQANAQAAQQAAEADAQKNQILTEQKIQLEQVKGQIDEKKMQMEAELKRQLMEQEFQYNMQLTQAQAQAKTQTEKEKEDRKDERTRIQATQQSDMIEQRKGAVGPKNFESAGFDNMGGFGMEQFDPK